MSKISMAFETENYSDFLKFSNAIINVVVLKELDKRLESIEFALQEPVSLDIAIEVVKLARAELKQTLETNGE